jgi:aminotransferase
VFRPQVAYYIMADIRPFGATDDTEFSRFLTSEVGVAPVPGSSFYSDPALGSRQVRFCFCKTDTTLDEAARRLQKLKR